MMIQINPQSLAGPARSWLATIGVVCTTTVRVGRLMRADDRAGRRIALGALALWRSLGSCSSSMSPW